MATSSHWAIVIGIDEYRVDVPTLSAAVEDAERFYEWVVSDKGGEVPVENVRLLLARRPDDQGRKDDERLPTKDAVMNAINEIMATSGASGEKFFFFFAGHGLTSTYANREESALVMSGYDERHHDETIAVRSITEFFETTQFKDQFFFIDACRDKPRFTPSEIGGWSIPRRRDPGQPPVQQFILYATPPGGQAREVGWPGEALGAFTKVLMSGLEGQGRAKAWSWVRGCYEVRWEALATYVKTRMEARKEEDPSEDREAIQVPQDAGSRGVVDRDRDARLASLSRRDVDPVKLTLELGADLDDEADLIVLDAIGRPVARAPKVTKSHTFTLSPRTYAARVTTSTGRIGRLRPPIELYDDDSPPRSIDWLPRGVPEEEDEPDADGTIEIRSPDPLAVADIRDETGRVVGVATLKQGFDRPPGFYRVRPIVPEREKTTEGQLVVLRGRAKEPVDLEAEAPPEHVAMLAEALGGSARKDHVVPVAGAAPVTWAQPSTVVTAALGAALHGDTAAQKGLAIEQWLADSGQERMAVALFAVAGKDQATRLEELSVRVWPAGERVPDEATPLKPTDAGVAAVIRRARPEMHWVSIEPPSRGDPTVVALPVLTGRLATLVVQVDPGRIRLYQFHPVMGPAPSTTPDRLRRLEHLQRLLLGGRVDRAQTLAEAVAAGTEHDSPPGEDRFAGARDDPFAGCLAGYILLRLGRYERLGELASAIVAVEGKLSDAYILRGEYEAYMPNSEAANQAFAQAVGVGIPAFGEGLTRLVEGLRVSGFYHPRGAIVRYIFQQHARGIMWAAFTPRNGRLEPGRLAITGADVGFEA